LVWKSFSVVGIATLTAEKSLAMTSTLILIAKSARTVVRSSLAIGAAYAKLERRMTPRLDSLALLLLLPLRGE
jgi:hypothetical protein